MLTSDDCCLCVRMQQVQLESRKARLASGQSAILSLILGRGAELASMSEYAASIGCCGHIISCVLVCTSWVGCGCLWGLFLLGLGPNAWLLCCRLSCIYTHVSQGEAVLQGPLPPPDLQLLGSILVPVHRSAEASSRCLLCAYAQSLSGQQAVATVGVVQLQGLQDSHVI